MIKVTVWTNWGDTKIDYERAKPKCIFSGEIFAIPRAGDYIILKEELGNEIVQSVTYDFVNETVEIKVMGDDMDNKYGACLRDA